MIDPLHMIATAYHLPFQVSCSNHALSSGAAVSLRLRAASADGLALLADVVDVFTRLADTGALGGDVPPWLCEWRPIVGHSQQANELYYHVECARLADEAIVVLTHLLLAKAESTKLEQLEVRALQTGAGQAQLQTSDVDSTYPRVYQPLPFELIDLDPEGGSFSFDIELEEAVKVESESWLNMAIQQWMEAILQGAYSLAPAPPQASYLEYGDESVTAYANKIEWAIFKLRADPVGSIDGLLNMLVAFDQRCQKIRLVEIS